MLYFLLDLLFWLLQWYMPITEHLEVDSEGRQGQLLIPPPRDNYCWDFGISSFSLLCILYIVIWKSYSMYRTLSWFFDIYLVSHSMNSVNIAVNGCNKVSWYQCSIIILTTLTVLDSDCFQFSSNINNTAKNIFMDPFLPRFQIASLGKNNPLYS